jgi:hypothetical protein
MSRNWRRDLLIYLLLAQTGLAYLAFELEDPQVWRFGLLIAAGINLVGWLHALRIARAIADTPTSRVASAAQGYVELRGTAQPYLGRQVFTPHTQLPCLWYRYTVERRDGNKWRHMDSGESAEPFYLADASGRCALDPAGAHIETTHMEVRTEGEQRHTEYVLLKGDVLYALGLFVSDRPEDRVLDARVDEGDLLAEWKENQAELHRRFDLDGDGAISPQEWLLARQAARREISLRHLAIRAEASRHGMGDPEDGRPYLISNLPPDGLGERYRWMSRVFAVLMLGSLTGLTYVLKAGV